MDKKKKIGAPHPNLLDLNTKQKRAYLKPLSMKLLRHYRSQTTQAH